MYKQVRLKGKNESVRVDIDPNKLLGQYSMDSLCINGLPNFPRRASYQFKDCAFVLPERFDWVIGKDRQGFLVLIPLLP